MPQNTTSTRFSGVTCSNNMFKSGNRWYSKILRGGRGWPLGTFDTEEEAATAYDRAVWLTRPWAKRGFRYNFPVSQSLNINVNDPSALTREEIAMLESLRAHEPAAEATFYEAEQIDSVLPIADFESTRQLLQNSQSFSAKALDRLSGAFAQFRQLSVAKRNLEDTVERQNRMIAELETERDELRAAVRVGQAGGFKLTKMAASTAVTPGETGASAEVISPAVSG